MNRKAQIRKMFDKRVKRAHSKLKNSSKERYISKADRAKAELENSAVESNAEES